LQIDECRIPYSKDSPPIPQLAQGKTSVNSKKTMFDGPSLYKSKTKTVIGGNSSGRYPAHLIHDRSDEVLDLFPESKGQLVTLIDWLDEKQYWTAKDAIMRNLAISPEELNEWRAARQTDLLH
jgi:hypothetical protein